MYLPMSLPPSPHFAGNMSEAMSLEARERGWMPGVRWARKSWEGDVWGWGMRECDVFKEFSKVA